MQSNSSIKSFELHYVAITFILIFISYSPYIFLDFGFHNDFTIWQYNNKICCNGFPENPHLINIGRFLQAYLQGFYLSFFTDLESLAYGRTVGLATAGLCALMLSSSVIKNGMGRLTGLAFGIAVFLLPSAQVNLGWVTNYVPGVLNAIFVLYAASIFPAWEDVSKANKLTVLKLVLSFIILIATLFNYPPTVGFFLIPVIARFLYSGGEKKEERVQGIYAIAFFALACLFYFIVHRFVVMKLLGISFPQNSFYRFDIAKDLVGNIWLFLSEIVPVMLNLWNPAPIPFVGFTVLLLIIVPPSIKAFKKCRLTDDRRVIKNSIITMFFVILIFGEINTPGLMAIGRPPAFYRTWHPGTAAIMFILFYGIDKLRCKTATNSLLFACLVAGSFFSFNSSMYLASTLSKQFNFALAQLKTQFSEERDRYIIIEKRPESLLFGRQRWGELGFIHILPQGHAIYVLDRYLDHHVHHVIENIVVTKKDNNLLLETELLEKSSSLFPRSPTEPENLPFVNLFDLRLDTSFEINGEMSSAINIVGNRPANVSCYIIYSDANSPPSRAPREWILSGTNDGYAWNKIDSQSNQTAWDVGENRAYFPMNAGNYRRYRLEIKRSNRDEPINISEIQLFTRVSACREPILLNGYAVDPILKKSITTSLDSTSINLAGTANTSSMSDPQFRLQRALDNIYYSFWETRGPFPVKVDFRFFVKRKIQCYAFQAGADRAGQRMPRSWRLLGSNDLLVWDSLDIRSDEPAWIDEKGLGDANINARRSYLVASPDSYLFYKLEFLSVYNSEEILRLYEMGLSEDPKCLQSMP